jgi:hypothetical protein
MSRRDPAKLHVELAPGSTPARPLLLPRTYTLTHSDATGDLFLTVGPAYNEQQCSGRYSAPRSPLSLLHPALLAGLHSALSLLRPAFLAGLAEWRGWYTRLMRDEVLAEWLQGDPSSTPSRDYSRAGVGLTSNASLALIGPYSCVAPFTSTCSSQ